MADKQVAISAADGSTVPVRYRDLGGGTDYAAVPAHARGWVANHAPAANTQATATKAAAGAGLRNVCTSITASIVAGAVAPAAVQVTVNLRDGATGAGAILWTVVLALPATAGASGDMAQLAGLWIEGSPNTAMTLEFSAAAGANTVESVAMTGVVTN